MPLTKVALEVQKSMCLVAKNKHLSLNVELDEDVPLIRFDYNKIVQVVTNLANNAIKFTAEGGITIKTQRQGNAICVTVSDTGDGIPEEDIPKLFKSF